MNGRNGELIQKYNPRSKYPNVDSKLRCKELCIEAGISVPKLLGHFSYVGELRRIKERLEPFDSFVLKPDHGSGGEGIMVLQRKNGELHTSSDKRISLPEIRHFVANSLYGMYSLGGQPDKVLIEKKVEFDPVFTDISYKGVPDIRIIIFLGIPVMAMLRLPTKASSGRANLHQGAIGVGVELVNGKTRGGVQGSTPLSHHPDTDQSIRGVQIPNWQDILNICFKASEAFGLGYFGLDIVLDSKEGPLVLEGNARPGLAIQLANHIGLRSRLDFIEKKFSEFGPLDKLTLSKKLELTEEACKP